MLTSKKHPKEQRRKESTEMWRWMKENHPAVYEVIQWGVLLVAVAALVHDFLSF